MELGCLVEDGFEGEELCECVEFELWLDVEW